MNLWCPDFKVVINKIRSTVDAIMMFANLTQEALDTDRGSAVVMLNIRNVFNSVNWSGVKGIL